MKTAYHPNILAFYSKISFWGAPVSSSNAQGLERLSPRDSYTTMQLMRM